MGEQKLSAIEKLNYIYKCLEGEEGYDADTAKQYAQEVGESVDDLGGRQCKAFPTIPGEG